MRCEECGAVPARSMTDDPDDPYPLCPTHAHELMRSLDGSPDPDELLLRFLAVMATLGDSHPRVDC